MRFLLWPLAFALTACSVGRDVGALHHPDLSLARLAREATGSGKLFTSYQAAGPVRWSQDWTWKLDLSGVAWDQSNTATVITPRHVVMAQHYTRKAGQELVFHDRRGRRHARVVQKVIGFKDKGLSGDVAIGLLDRPLPDSIRAYPLPAPLKGGGEELIGATALVTEQYRDLYFHQIMGVGDLGLRLRFDPEIPDSRRKRLIVGDSGHPSFLLSKGELLLLETHTTGGAGAGPFYGSEKVLAGVREIVRELDPTYKIRTVAIDRRTLDEAAAARASMPQARRPSSPPANTPAPSITDPAPRRPRPRVVPPTTE